MASDYFHKKGVRMSRGKYEDMLEGRSYKNSHDVMDDYSGSPVVQPVDSYVRSHNPSSMKSFYKTRLGLGFCAATVKSKQDR